MAASRRCRPTSRAGSPGIRSTRSLADAKTSFQEWAHASLRATPSYHTLADTGIEDDAQRFTVEVRVLGEGWGTGTGRSKRLAERAAATAALVRCADQKDGGE